MKKDCIFCKIVRGEVPCSRVYEDDVVLAFLDVAPVTEGHTLIIPKKHYQDIKDLPGDVFQHISKVIKKLSIIYGEKLGFKEFNILNASGKNAQQTIFHFHMHLVPRHKDDNLNLWYHIKTKKQKNKNILKKLKS